MKNKKINPVSLVINTQNEEDQIAQCIKSVGDFANEIIVVDMQSTDQTVAIAKKLGAKVFKVKNYGYVEPARNFALNKANQKWILLLDADERLNQRLKNKLNHIINQNYYDVVKMARKNIIFKKWLKGACYWPNYQTRFFKKNSLTWPKEIHSQPKIKKNKKIIKLKPNYFIKHLTKTSYRHFLKKTDAYASYDQNFKKYFQIKSMTAHEVINYIDLGFTRNFFDNQGYKDGVHGFILSKLMEVYRFSEFAKYWIKRGCPEFFEPQELKTAVEQVRKEEEEVDQQQNSFNINLQVMSKLQVWIKKFFKL